VAAAPGGDAASRGLFSAVRIPECLLATLSTSTEAAACLDDFLAEALGGGPVICDPRFSRYYALVPARMPATLHQMAEECVPWRWTASATAATWECLGWMP
jgi:hypothetical protein